MTTSPPTQDRFLFTEEHDALREAVRDLLATRQSADQLRRVIDGEHALDPELWSLAAGQLGLHGLLIAEQHGGSGAGFVELGIVLEEMGAALLAGPFLASAVFAVALLDRADDADRARYLPGIADGSVIATAALTGAARARLRGAGDVAGLPVQASTVDGGWVLDGTERTVLAGASADVIVIPARIDGGVELFTVAGSASGLRRTPLNTPDLTRRFADCELTSVPAERLEVADVAHALGRGLDLASIALAVESAGSTNQLLGMTVDYLRQRYQFGRPIGSFQAIKHRCADLLVGAETARSAAYHAMWAAAQDAPDLTMSASLAKAYCADVFVHAAAETIQLHGGIGFTWEHPAHLYYRRAKSSQHFLGSPDEHREQLARHLTHVSEVA